MPLTDELGNLVMAYLHDRFEEPIPVEFRGGLFETWLSQLAEDQPYLWPDENLNQRATFSRCTTYLAEVIERRVAASLDDALSKAWMLPLLSTLHARRATLVTFNQDTLIERAIKESELKTWDKDEWITSGEQPEISWFDATGGLPPLPARGGWDAGVPKQTFHLLKLHGSTNWFRRPGDRSSATLVSWWLEGEAEGDAARPDESAAKRRMLPGTRAFVVPPSSTKSAFYDNPLVEELWRSARRALEEATKVSLLGYSMPPTDTVTSNLLRKTLVESPAGVESSVEVVNPDPGIIVERLVAMGVSKDRITVIDSVDNYARNYVDLAAAEVARAFVEVPDASESQALLLVGSSIKEALPVHGIRSEDGSTTVELILEEIPNPPKRRTTATRRRPHGHHRGTRGSRPGRSVQRTSSTASGCGPRDLHRGRNPHRRSHPQPSHDGIPADTVRYSPVAAHDRAACRRGRIPSSRRTRPRRRD